MTSQEDDLPLQKDHSNSLQFPKHEVFKQESKIWYLCKKVVSVHVGLLKMTKLSIMSTEG